MFFDAYLTEPRGLSRIIDIQVAMSMNITCDQQNSKGKRSCNLLTIFARARIRHGFYIIPAEHDTIAEYQEEHPDAQSVGSWRCRTKMMLRIVDVVYWCLVASKS